MKGSLVILLVILVILLGYILYTKSYLYRRYLNNYKIIAHKCNSFYKIDKALSAGIKIIEIDIHVCKTGELVVRHDSEIDKNEKTIFVEQTDLKTLKQLGVITLEDVINRLSNKATLLLDLKPVFMGDYKLMIGSLSKLINRNKKYFTDNTIVSSFDHRMIRMLKNAYPEIPRAIITASTRQNLLKDASELKCSYISVNYTLISPEMLKEADKRDIKLIVYTVNNSKTFKEINKSGLLYGIITDDF